VKLILPFRPGGATDLANSARSAARLPALRSTHETPRPIEGADNLTGMWV